MLATWEICWFILHAVVISGLAIVYILYGKLIGNMVWTYIYVFNYLPGFLFYAPGWGDFDI